MASEGADTVAESEAMDLVVSELIPDVSSQTFTKELIDEPVRTTLGEKNVTSSSSYTLTSQSQFSSDVDRWLRGSSVASTGVQNSRVHLEQRSALATTASLGISGMWYVLAMILPLFSANTNYNMWRCNPSFSAITSTAELFVNQMAIICEKVRTHIRRLVRDEAARELFATAMDVVLVVYAVGFLILSMYQASMIG